MLRFCRLAVPMISAVLVFAGTLQAQPPAFQPPVTEAVVKTGPITLDGMLNEHAWRTAPTITLTQQNPHPGQSTPFTTTVRILRGQSHLYFSIVCTDPHPAKIDIHTLQRDASQSDDDNVMIVLDTFGQKKLAYVFQANAGGAIADGLISPGSEGVDYSWNGYWEAEVKRTATGWTAEVRINTQSLQFNNKNPVWGLNVSRYVPRDQLTLAWSGINLNAAVTNLQWEGKLTGTQGLNQGTGFEFDPYAVTEYSDAKRDTASWTGFDLKYNFTPELAGRFTYHTDFSEVQANSQQINASPYARPIQETRAFFLEGANIFSFSHNLGNSFIPFYSRSIGLINGETVPLNEGVKLLGHTDGWTLGMLDAQMAGTGFSDATNLFVGRAVYNVNNHWRIGTLVTNGDPSGQGTNRLTSFDSTWSTSMFDGDKNLNVSGWAARSSGSDVPAGSPNGYGFDIEYPNDLWYVDFNYNYFGDALDPGLGFIQRPGTKQSYLNVIFQPRPNAANTFAWVRQFFFYVDWNYVTSPDNQVLSDDWQFTPINFVSQAGWSLSTWICPSYEVVTTPFEIVPGTTVPPGRYHFSVDTLNISTPAFAPLVFGFQGKSGGFYGGTEHAANASLYWAAPGGHFTSSLQSGVIWIHTPTGNGIVRFSQMNVGYSFTPRLTLSVLTQYNNISHNTSENTILQWNFQPDQTLYVGWNHGLTLDPNLLQAQQTISGTTLFVKLQWGIY